MFSRIALLFIIAPLIELYLLFVLGSWIGATPVIAWTILSGVIGIELARRQGSAFISSWRSRLAAGELPEQGVLYGALLFLGALLLVVPGLFSDLVGMLLLIAPARRGLTTYIHKNIEAQSKVRSNFHIQGSEILFQNRVRPTQASGPWSVVDLSNSEPGPHGRSTPIIDAEIISDSSDQDDSPESSKVIS